MSKTSDQPKVPFVPSMQQGDFLTWVVNGNGSAFLEAVAGAGKTTTLVRALASTTGRVAFAAYNKKIAFEIEAKVDELIADGEIPADIKRRLKIGTFHSFGFNAWRKVAPKVKVDDRGKGDMLIKACQIPEPYQGFVMTLIGLAKNRAINPVQELKMDPWLDIVEHHGLYEMLPENNGDLEFAIGLARKGLKWSRDIAYSLIDFDDMIYMPAITNLDIWQNDWMFVDEAQDTNPARRILASKMLKRRGRSVWVGDRHQAIYGFTGADNDAVDIIIREFKCTQMPLTITYRCPKAVVEEARKYVSHIEAAPTAPAGIVRGLKEAELAKEGLKFGDAVLCRKTKPLVDVAFMLVRNDIPCYIEGREFGTGLVRLIDRMKAKDLDALISKLEEYKEREMKKYLDKGREAMAGEVEDRVETIFALMRGVQDVKGLVDKINGLFEDSEGKPKPAVVLSTVHKSKGREWNRVYILGYKQYMPSSWAKAAWEHEQETNIIYVAVTRSQNELILVEAIEKK